MDIGVKLTCGYEILYWENYTPQVNDIRNIDEETELALMKNKNIQKQWKEYLQRLNTMNYFRNEMEGSALYKQLEKQARKSFLLLIMNKDSSSEESISNWIDSVIEHYSPNLNIKTSDRIKEDDDSWLDRGEGLDEFIEMKHQDVEQQKAQLSEEELMQQKANEIITGVKDFINNVSTIEGAEVPSKKSTSKKLEDLFSGLRLEDLVDEEDLVDLDRSEYENEDSFMTSYMAEMDEQLSNFGNSLNHKSQTDENLDYDILKNLLESYKSQLGSAGPLSNLMGEMNIDIPDDIDN